MKRLKASFTAILLLLVMVACSSSSPAPINEFPEDEMITPILTLDANCDLSTIKTWRSGTLSDGSKYEIYRPSSLLWFFISPKLLFVFAHGYFDPYYPEEPVLPNVYAGEHDALICSLVQSGAAVAWTSYANNGYAVKSGYDSTEELRQLAASEVGARYTYLIGHSQGGTVATMIAEQLGSFDATLSLCGPIGGWPVQAQYVGHVRVLFDAYFQNSSGSYTGTLIPATDYTQPATHLPDNPALIPWTGHYNGSYVKDGLDDSIKQAVLANPALAAQLASEPFIMLPYANQEQLARSIADALYFSVRGTNQTMAITGGSPFGNPDADYETDAVIRYSPTSTASRQYIRDYYETTGNLRGRLLALHTVHDPVVPFSHQAYYQDKVTANGNPDLFARQYVRRYGHCVFNDDEIIDGLNALRDWREKGVRPQSNSDVTIARTGEEIVPTPFDPNDMVKFARLEPGPSELSVIVSSGGTVTSAPPRIDCGSTCSAYFGAGLEVTFTAVPEEGYDFSGWSGACSGSSTTCTITLDRDSSVTALFEAAAPPPPPPPPPPPAENTLTVIIQGTGNGTVTSTPHGIDCDNICSASFSSGTTVTLQANPATGSTFAGWSRSECDSVSNPQRTCTVTLSSDRNVSATFNLVQPKGKK